VPTYGYDCARCGPFDLVRPMAQASAPAACPQCGDPGRRVWGAPALRGLDPALRGALDADARRADSPDVVAAPPTRRGRTRHTTDPRHLRLPRP
jgi:putative FmdB family regulatory protein